jgi:uncharacterized glyoxalase superfamily protein PhnB
MASRKKSKNASRPKIARKAAVKKSTAKPARAKKATAAKKSSKTSPKSNKKSTGFQLTSLAPSLTVNDVNQSLAWYRDVLGFTVTQRWEGDGVLRGVELKAGDVTLYLSQEDGAKGERVKGVGFRLYWYTDQNIDKIAAGITSRGGTLASEPKDEWGVRAFSLDDPTGYKITVSSNR